VGRELQKSYGQGEQQIVITAPILEGLDGVQKMSKSLDNYISIVDSPKDMFGKTMRVSDELMVRWYELLTDITPHELIQLKADLASGKKHPRDAKVNLAKVLISRFHSLSAAQAAEDEFQRIFVDKGLPDEVPEFSVPASSEAIWICALMKNAGLAPSTSEAKRLIQGRAVEIDGTKLENDQLKLPLHAGAAMVIKAGKKKFVKVVVK
jgi:tyrosyl-tRNA synthetase